MSEQTPAKVYFTDFRTYGRQSALVKLNRLCRKAGIETIDFDNKFVAIKLHLGEPGGTAYLRPNYVKVIVDLIRELGGKPFLTDCNTLYVGGRKNALDHLDSAYTNGFNPFCTGCHVIIADGLKGTDDVEVPVVGGEFVEKAKIGRAIMDADVFVSVTHFKGHEQAGFGGTIKNIGMGSGSRAGKMEQHSAGKPSVDQGACIGCRQCAKICAHDAFSFSPDPVRGGKHVLASIDHDKCVGCGRCIAVCNQDAIQTDYDAAVDVLNDKMVEYAKAVVDGRPSFHVSLVMDVTPNCDCHNESDSAIVPNIGMFASFDPVALDQACVDAVNAAPKLPGTELTDMEAKHPDDDQMDDHFHMVHPDTRWQEMLAHGEKIGLGTRSYELITIR